VKKALSKLEMRNLKDSSSMPGQGMPWPVPGCGPAGGNVCNVSPMNYGTGCNVGGFGANCNFAGPGKCGIGMNSGNQMGKAISVCFLFKYTCVFLTDLRLF